MAYRNGLCRCCRSLQWRRAGLDPREKALVERPARWQGLNNIIMSLLCYFRRSFEVGNAGRSCAGSDLGNVQDGLENRRRLTGSTRGVLTILKHVHLPETEN